MKIYAPIGSTQASARGITLTVEADGSLEVPHDVAQDLISGGFTIEPPVQIEPSAPLTKWQQTKADKEAADLAAAAAIELATKEQALADAKDAAAAALAAYQDSEGRGDVEVTEAARAASDAAAAAVKALEV